MNDYTKFAIKRAQPQSEISVEEIQNGLGDVTIEEVPEQKSGVIAGCTKLNVREKPDAAAPVVTVIDDTITVTIDENESTKDFYKVSFDNGDTGFNGFCMKKYIKVLP